MRWPMVLMMRQPPAMVPPAMAKWQQMMTQLRDFEGLQEATCHQSGSDNPHAFSERRFVPWAEACRGRRKTSCRPAEPTIDFSEDAASGRSKLVRTVTRIATIIPSRGERKMKKNGLKPAAKDNGLETGVRNGGATVNRQSARARKLVGRPRTRVDQIPSDRAEEGRQESLFRRPSRGEPGPW